MSTAILVGAAQHIVASCSWPTLVVVVLAVLFSGLYREHQRLRFVRKVLRDRSGDRIAIKEEGHRWSSVIEITPTRQGVSSSDPHNVVPLRRPPDPKPVGPGRPPTTNTGRPNERLK
jgi:hypothetical protein